MLGGDSEARSLDEYYVAYYLQTEAVNGDVWMLYRRRYRYHVPVLVKPGLVVF